MENKFSAKMSIEERRKVPHNILKDIYDRNDNVLFGSGMIKGKVAYKYLPAEFMDTNRPFIIVVSISYDGEGNTTLPEDAIIKDFKELREMFPDNTFS